LYNFGIKYIKIGVSGFTDKYAYIKYSTRDYEEGEIYYFNINYLN